MVTTRPPKTIVEPTTLSTVANTDTKLLIYVLFQKGRVLAQDGDGLSGLQIAPGLTLVNGLAAGAKSRHPVLSWLLSKHL